MRGLRERVGGQEIGENALAYGLCHFQPCQCTGDIAGEAREVLRQMRLPLGDQMRILVVVGHDDARDQTERRAGGLRAHHITRGEFVIVGHIGIEEQVELQPIGGVLGARQHLVQ